MAEFTPVKLPMICRGVQLSKPIDKLDPYKYANLTNVVNFQDGVIQSRPGLVKISTVPSPKPINALRRLNDPANSDFTRIVGDNNGGLRASKTDFSGTVVDLLGGAGIGTGYSGDPLSLIPFRPAKSPQPWMYVGNKNKMAKVRPDGKAALVGIAPPLQPPLAVLLQPNIKIIDDFSNVGVPWGSCGTPNNLNPLTQVFRIDPGVVSLTQIVYDSGTSGWASASMTAAGMSAIGVGTLIDIVSGNAENDVEIFKVFRNPINNGAASTIGAIQYDSGVTGACTIVPSVPITDIVQDCLILIGGAGAETVRVTSINTNRDKTISFRCVTANTHAAAATLIGVPSFRAYFASTHAAGATVRSWAYQITDAHTPGKTGSYLTLSNPPSDTVSGVCDRPESLFSPTLDLTNIGGRQVQPGDLIHISILLSDVPDLLEGIIYFDVDGTTDPVTGDPNADFAHNFYYYQFSAADLAPIGGASQTVESALTTAQQKALALAAQLPPSSTNTSPGTFNPVPNVQPTVGQTTTGETQWSELTFRVGQLTRVGNDSSRGLADIGRIGILFGYQAPETFQISSFWAGGTYGPDEAGGQAYSYRFRARSQQTGAQSLPGPPTRFKLPASRTGVSITPSYVPDPQVDSTVEGVLAIERFGGSLDTWREIGIVENASGGPAAFLDSFEDLIVEAEPAGDETNFQPFPIAQLPVNGTVNAIGNKIVWVSGDKFNTGWAPGIQIQIGTLYYTLYASPTDTTNLEIIENAGNLSGVNYSIQVPILQGQPLPALWGPNPQTGEMFGCQDPINAGRLYWTNGNDPDSADDANYADVTQPTEPLINGGIYRDAVNILFSSERMFKIYPQTGGGFVVQDVVNSKGLLSRTALCFGPKIWFRGKDGIYETDGSPNEPLSITDEDLLPFFPHGGVPGVSDRGYFPPDDTKLADEVLSYDNGFVRWTFTDTTGNRQSWFYDVNLDSQGRPFRAWYPQNYPDKAPLLFYDEEGQGLESLLAGGSTGNIYQVAGSSDDGANIVGTFRTKAVDLDDSRLEKLWGDLFLDINPGGNLNGIVVTPEFDNSAVLLPPRTIGTGLNNRQPFVLDFNAGMGQLAKNFGLLFQWSEKVPVYFYEWAPSIVGKENVTMLRATDWTDDGYAGAKWLQGCVIEFDTQGNDRTVQVQGDNGVVIATITLNNNGQVEAPFSWNGAYTHNIRLLPTDANSWLLYKVRWIWEPAPELTTTWETPDMTLWSGYGHLRDAYIPVLSAGTVVLTVTIDGVAYQYTIPAGSSLRETKPYFPLQAIKGKVVRFKLAADAGFRLFQQDVELRAKGFREEGLYRAVKPFGDQSVVKGAAI